MARICCDCSPHLVVPPFKVVLRLCGAMACYQDPSIKQLAEQIAKDPSFQGLTSQLQDSMAGLMGGGRPDPSAMPDPASFDPPKYMQAMSSMYQNPTFMRMAEKLGQAIIQVMR